MQAPLEDLSIGEFFGPRRTRAWIRCALAFPCGTAPMLTQDLVAPEEAATVSLKENRLIERTPR
jgi:hypothetical protein